MSPSGEVGAVATIRDAALLSRIIGEEGVSTESIGKYEKRNESLRAEGNRTELFQKKGDVRLASVRGV